MNKVIIVDDDQPVLEFIEKSIPWKSLDLQLIGTFENGMMALEQAQVDMPDIVITDIYMPHMNGLELT
jgi:two-component system response regulator YesN